MMTVSICKYQDDRSQRTLSDPGGPAECSRRVRGWVVPRMLFLAWLTSFISQGCSGDEREMAKMVADTISRTEKQVVVEGQEPANFWMALGGKAPYANTKRYYPSISSPASHPCSV